MGARLEALLASTVGQAGACRLLGVDRHLVAALVRIGALEKAYPTDPANVPNRYRTVAVEALVARISGGAERPDVIPPGQAAIAAAVRICYRESIHIVAAILDGRLVPRGKPAGAGILDTLVDTAEVIRVLPRLADPNLISVKEATSRLGVSVPTVAVLKVKGLLSTYKGDTRVRTVSGIDAREVAAIKADHVSTFELAAWAEPPTDPVVIHRLLAAAGVRPSLDAPQPLFDRANAERAIAAWDRSRAVAAVRSVGP